MTTQSSEARTAMKIDDCRDRDADVGVVDVLGRSARRGGKMGTGRDSAGADHETARTRPNVHTSAVASPARPKSISAQVFGPETLCRLESKKRTWLQPNKARYVDVANPSLAVTARAAGFAPQVHRPLPNCATSSGRPAPWPRAAFKAWQRSTPPAWRLAVRPRAAGRARQGVDYEAAAHQLASPLSQQHWPLSSASAPSPRARAIPFPARCASVCW